MGGKARCVVVTAPTNIAVVKYWGKRCQKLNLPLNSSLSATLSQDHLKTTTKVTTSPSYLDDEIWLNGIKQEVETNRRVVNCLSEIRRLARKQRIARSSDSASDITFCSQKIHIHSENNFPTAAGLASSASGYAALVFALATLFGVEGDVTAIARQGSGSACRSLHGGFVKWQKGSLAGGEDSIGIQVVPESHWPGLRIFVVVANDSKKKVGSTEGMQRSVNTSSFLQHRAENVVDRHMQLAFDAIMRKDFPALAEIIMKESNQLHAVCLDSFPPLRYLRDVSHTIIDLIHAYNKAAGSVRAAYTFDAGPNACVFTTEAFASDVAWLITNYFPNQQTCENDFLRGLSITPTEPSREILDQLYMEPQKRGLIKYAILTTLGFGPQVLSVDELAEA